MNILFWNTYKNKNKINIDNCITDLLAEKNCDIIVLAEYLDDIISLCEKINMSSKEEYMPIPNFGGCEKIIGIIKRKYKVESIREQNRYQIIKIETTYYILLLAMIHNLSKKNYSPNDQEQELICFHRDIVEAEKECSTKNTLVIGDFNINPYETSCISANAMHAIPYIEEVEKNSRVIQGRRYEKFYNPTWRFLGNRQAPYATYYYNSSENANYFWNMFDQVIIRPQLIKSFVDNSLIIITCTKNHSLLCDNKPNKNNYSDHLPIFCILDEEHIK